MTFLVFYGSLPKIKKKKQGEKNKKPKGGGGGGEKLIFPPRFFQKKKKLKRGKKGGKTKGFFSFKPPLIGIGFFLAWLFFFFSKFGPECEGKKRFFGGFIL